MNKVFYEIRYPVWDNKREEKHWLRIGSATGLDTGQILCTVEAMPLNWDGQFHLFPSKQQEETRGVTNIS